MRPPLLLHAGGQGLPPRAGFGDGRTPYGRRGGSLRCGRGTLPASANRYGVAGQLPGASAGGLPRTVAAATAAAAALVAGPTVSQATAPSPPWP